MDPTRESELELRLARMEGTIDDLSKDVRRMRIYSQITFWGGLLLFLGPMLILPFALPFFLSNYLGTLSLPDDSGSSGASGQVSAQDLEQALGQLGF
ncbi:MAG TPA: hypothetical protein VFL98_01965 [Candidatus Paceibacterota bacterium]|nr:hypothetical protein [Candidatus Paceibacterota bacterium]